MNDFERLRGKFSTFMNVVLHSVFFIELYPGEERELDEFQGTSERNTYTYTCVNSRHYQTHIRGIFRHTENTSLLGKTFRGNSSLTTRRRHWKNKFPHP